MSTITEVVDQQLDAAGLREYRGQADRVVQVLEEREAAAVTALIDFAVEQGLPRDTACEAISEAGLNVPIVPVEDTPDSNQESDTDARLARMEANIERLMGVARDRGLI